MFGDLEYFLDWYKKSRGHTFKGVQSYDKETFINLVDESIKETKMKLATDKEKEKYRNNLITMFEFNH